MRYIARMTGASPEYIAAIAITLFLAGIVKGVIGMGLPTVSMAMLGSIMPPVAAASLLIVPSFVTNMWQLLAGPDFRGLAARLWPMLAGLLAATIACSGLLTAGTGGWTKTALGAAIAFYAALGLLELHWRVSSNAKRRLPLFIGLSTGIVTGATGVSVVPAVPYLQALGLFRDDLIQSLGLTFTVSSIALTIGLSSRGAFHLGDAAASALAIVPALMGMWVGQRIRERISVAAFRRWFLVALLLLGLELMLRRFL